MNRLQALELVNMLNVLNIVPAIKKGQKQAGYEYTELISDSDDPEDVEQVIVYKGVWHLANLPHS